MSCGLSNIIWLCFKLLLLSSVIFGLEWQQKPTDISIPKGGDARFNCSVRDRGNNIVTWSKDGQTIFVNNNNLNGDSRYSLVGEFNLLITNVVETDEAEYTCTVQSLGFVTAHLTVLIPPGSPNLSVNDSRVSFVEGNAVSISCSTSGGNPAPTFQWRKNGELLPLSVIKDTVSVAHGQSSSHIVLTLDRSDHQAQYTCVVFNSLNQDRPLTKTQTLQVQYSPHISFGQYSPLVILKDTSAVLHCNVDANPTITTVTWRKNGSVIPAISPTLTFSSVSESIRGVYSCTASNFINGEKKESTNTTTIDVIYKPNVIVPHNLTVNESQTAVVDCTVQANPEAFEVKWEKPGVTMAASSTLTINNIQRSHKGDYICTARNRLRPSGQPETIGVTQKTTKIFVQYKPGNAFIQPISPVLIGQELQLKCIISSQDQGYPEPTFEWKKLDINRILSQTTANLVIPSASLNDNGNYSCTPKNTMGRGGTSVILVEVYEKPVFVDHPSIEAVIPNNRSRYSFQCKVRGRPPPSIQWFKDGQPLEQFTNIYTINSTAVPGSTYNYITTSQVILQGSGRPQQLLMFEDIGNYTCTATSSADTVSTPLSHTLKLLILFPPKTSSPEKVATSFGQTKELICTAEAYPTSNFTWYKETTPITAGGRYVIELPKIITVSMATSILRITNVQTADLGEFNCRAENRYGWATKTIILVSKSRPEAPNNISMISKTWESVYLRWMSGFDGGEMQSFYVHYTSIPPTAHGSWNVSVVPHQALKFNVSRLMPHTTYEFRVYGKNSLGAGEKSEPITIRTDHLAFPQINEVPEFKVVDRTLHFTVSVNDSYCVRVKVSKDSGRSWKTVVIKNADCFDAKRNMLTIDEDGVDRLNMSLCLLDRQDVCGSHISAIIKQQTTPDLTEGQVIVIGCVCAAILVVLLIILVIVICRRRQIAKKYENSTQSNLRPPNANGIPPAKPIRGFDNQGMDTIDSLDHRAQRTTHGSVPEPYTQLPHNVKNSSNSVQTDRNGYTNSPGVTRPNGSVPPLDTSYDSQLEKHLFENEMNRINAANMRGDPYYDSKTGDISFNGTPRKDPQQFIDLPPDHKGDIGPESGYSTAETHKPKKFKTKHRHPENPYYYDDFVPFAHDPPGHTCGLPCCNSDLHIHLKVGRSHGGCMSVPMQHEHPADNFTLQRGHLGLFKGQVRPGINGGFYSVQPVRTGVPPRRDIPEFGSVRGKSLPAKSGVAGTATSLSDQMHFLRGRGITLPNIARKDPAAFKKSSPFILAGGNIGETPDTDSDMSSDSDLDYYMLSDFKTHVQVTNDGNRYTEYNNEGTTEKEKSLYPWKMLEDTQKEQCKSESLSEGSAYYDVIEDVQNSNYTWSTDKLEHVEQPDETQENEKTGSTKYCTLNFESNLFTPDRRHTLDTTMRYNPPKHEVHKKKHRKRRTKPVPDPKPQVSYMHGLSDSYKSRSLPPVFQNIDHKTVEEARSRLKKVHVRPNIGPVNNPKNANPVDIEKTKSQLENKTKDYFDNMVDIPAHLNLKRIEKTSSLPTNKTQDYVNKGFVQDNEDNSVEILKRLVNDFKSQSLPTVFRPISFDAARVARSRLNSSEDNVNDVFYRQDECRQNRQPALHYQQNRLPTLDEDPITLIL